MEWKYWEPVDYKINFILPPLRGEQCEMLYDIMFHDKNGLDNGNSKWIKKII